MYIHTATLEDVPDIIQFFRDELYPHLDRKRLAYDASIIEGSIRHSAHNDRYHIAQIGGSTAGFVWTRKIRLPGMYKPSLVPIALLVSKKHIGTGTAMELLRHEDSYGRYNGLDTRQIISLMNRTKEPHYRGEGFVEFQTPEGGLAEAPRDRRRYWGPGRKNIGEP